MTTVLLSEVMSKLSERNQIAFANNEKYFREKVDAGRFDEGRWQLQIRRVNSWD